MNKLILLFIALLFCGIAQPQNNQGGNTVLVLLHDTTVVTSQAKRLADKDSLQKVLSVILANYDLATIDSNSTLPNLANYKSVILQETSFDATICRYLGVAGRNALKTWLNSGTAQDKKTLVSIGADQGYNYSRSGSAGRDLVFSQDLLMYNYRVDNGTSAATGYSIEGVGVDAGNTRTMTNVPTGGGYYPDGVQPLGNSTTLYKYSNRSALDTVAAVGVDQTGYLGLSLFQDPRYFTNNSFQEVLLATLLYAVANGGTFPGLVPVELVSFSASVVGTEVNLSWMTATELNNQGFEIERSTNQAEWEKIGFVEGKGTTTLMNYYSYAVKSLKTGTYFYRLKQVDFDGTFEYSSIVEVEVSIPIEFALQQNYPNPFNPSTKIKFSLAADAKVLLKVYNILGQEIVTLFNGNLATGEHEVDFNASGLNSGVLLYQLNAEGTNGIRFSSVKKMILSK
jgi:hypothetical protein